MRALYVLNTGSPTICIFMPHHVYLFMSQPECSVNTWYQIGRPAGQLDERIQQAKPTVVSRFLRFLRFVMRSSQDPRDGSSTTLVALP